MAENNKKIEEAQKKLVSDSELWILYNAGENCIFSCI